MNYTTIARIFVQIIKSRRVCFMNKRVKKHNEYVIYNNNSCIIGNKKPCCYNSMYLHCILKSMLQMQEIIYEHNRHLLLDDNTISSNVMKALLNIQKDSLYKHASENTINDGIRNQLSMIYDVKDQTRCGYSANGMDAGEIDIMLCSNGNPIAFIEGLKLNCLNNDYLDKHITKAVLNYNPIGCPLIYILIYVTAKDFNGFWKKTMNHISNFVFPYKNISKLSETPTAYTESRHANVVLNRNGKNVSIHIYAISMG